MNGHQGRHFYQPHTGASVPPPPPPPPPLPPTATNRILLVPKRPAFAPQDGGFKRKHPSIGYPPADPKRRKTDALVPVSAMRGGPPPLIPSLTQQSMQLALNSQTKQIVQRVSQPQLQANNHRTTIHHSALQPGRHPNSSIAAVAATNGAYHRPVHPHPHAHVLQQQQHHRHQQQMSLRPPMNGPPPTPSYSSYSHSPLMYAPTAPSPPVHTYNYPYRQTTAPRRMGVISRHYQPSNTPTRRSTPQIFHPLVPMAGSFGASHTKTQSYVDLTKEIVAEKESLEIQYGSFKGLLFGPDYLQPEVDVGLNVEMTRQRGDSEISVLKTDENQVIGHVDVITKDAFSQLMDENEITLKGQIIQCEEEIAELLEIPVGRYAARLKVSVYGNAHRAQAIAHRLKSYELQWDHRHPKFMLPTATRPRSQTSSDMDISIQVIENDFNSIFGGAMGAENLKPMAPGKALKAKLLEYQKVGLHWMVKRERRNIEKSLFWVEKKSDKGYNYWFNTATNKKQSEEPEEFRGGILADDMGLGKTIQSISLICTSMPKRGPTLIVAPLSVLETWVKQIKQHTHKNSLSYMVYYGTDRGGDPDELSRHDIVITTYNIVGQEWSDVYGKRRKNKKSSKKDDEENDDEFDMDEQDDEKEDEDREPTTGVHAIEWLRVMLDEAHAIRTRKTRVFKACSELKAVSRWALTGTPVQNKLDDLYSLICFLRVEPLTDLRWWKAIILNPLKQQDESGLEKLRQLLKVVCLRRTKETKVNGKPIVNLPPKRIRVETLDFNREELRLYSHLEAKSKQRFDKISKEGVFVNYAHVLEMLLRLRQCCGHPQLVPSSYLRNDKLDTEDIHQRVNLMLSQTDSDCCSCWRTVVDPVITPCAHLFCRRCLTSELDQFSQADKSGVCPFCRSTIVVTNIMDVKIAKQLQAENELAKAETRDIHGNLKPSAKIRSLIDYVLNKPYDVEYKGPNKCCVFSQWTSMLDLVQECLKQEGIKFVRLDGRMTRKARIESLQAFQNDSTVLVFLLSLKAGNLGLNLTEANRVFVLDPWWNPSQEDQAIDRVHRLGQVRPVEIIRFVMRDSVEEKIIKLQEKKRQLVRGALGNVSKEEMRQMMMRDLKSLFT